MTPRLHDCYLKLSSGLPSGEAQNLNYAEIFSKLLLPTQADKTLIRPAFLALQKIMSATFTHLISSSVLDAKATRAMQAPAAIVKAIRSKLRIEAAAGGGALLEAAELAVADRFWGSDTHGNVEQALPSVHY